MKIVFILILFRLFDLYDESIKIRFSNISNSLIYQFQNLNEIIFPGSVEYLFHRVINKLIIIVS